MYLALLAAVVITLLSVVGAFFFGTHGKLRGTHRFVLPLSIGVLLGVVFFELIPEALHEAETYGSAAIVAGFLGFYLLSHKLRTYHHHHDKECNECVHPASAKLVLMGDAVHNFADGIVIASAFAINPAVGVATALGIALHEIPQEIAEFSILIGSGLSRGAAIARNMLSASIVIVGVLFTSLLFSFSETLVGVLIGVAAGNLLYIAATDLLPELDREHAKRGHFWQVFSSVLVGLVVMAFLVGSGHA